MNSKVIFSSVFLGIVLLAGVTGFFLTQADDTDGHTSKKAPQAEKSSTLPSLPANKPMQRSNRRDANTSGVDDVPPFALANERIIRFKDDDDYRKFLASLNARGLRLLGKSDRLRAVRVGFSSLTSLDDIEGGELAYNYLVTLPTPPGQGEAQAGAMGFGRDALSWLGINVDNSLWGKGVTVAVIDSGVNQHIAFNGGVTNIELTTLADGSSQLSHGTAVASIISGDHPLTKGVAPASDILSIRVTDDSGSSDSFTLAEGIMQAADAGAQVINISMGTFANSSLVADAVLYAQERGAVIVASSGNEGYDAIAYPAAYPGVISVGAVESQGEHLDFSNSGNQLSITAPGYQVNAAWGEEQLTAFSGTSASAPFVSGAIAATMSANPQMTAQQAANLVIGLANDAGLPGNDSDFGGGILDVGRVMQSGTPGIYDAAVTGQVLVPASSPTSLPKVLVTVQNQGTEPLINSPVTITSPSGSQQLNISSLSPGQTQTFQIPIAIPANGDPVTVSTTVTSSAGDQDSSNNSRSNSFARQLEE
ncbi:hypothetical protein NT6N_12460 [Oceaniferula spumae]|uniref:Peptidase S8/S53 domain-containing protein n=1 Tax=Oceaniferula spumae TaxID=2979115 RepID=A0AAT9FJT0_9BACT